MLQARGLGESGPLTVHLGMSTYHAISGRGISQLGNPDG